MNLLEERVESVVAVKNILFATDFSAVSEAALPYVTALSLRYGSTVHVVHVLPDTIRVGLGAPDPSVMGAIYEEAHSTAQENIQQLCARLRGFPHRTYVRHGQVVEVITELIREQEIDMLVLGTHGRTGLGRLIIGSVAEQLFRETSCPVLTVGPGIPPVAKVRASRHDHGLPPPQVKFREILFATDLKTNSAQNVKYAISLASEFKSRLSLLHVIESFGEDLHQRPGPIDAALRKLEELVPEQNGLIYRPEFLAEFGSPDEVIVKIASEYEADLIILGARPASGRLGAATHFGSSTAHNVVVGANCPVLTIRS